MSLFGLVHGAMQGAWCWDLLIPDLEAAGHTTITVELPIEDASASLSDFANVVLQALPPTEDEVILVGHSMAGTVIPLVAQAYPVHQLIFLCALIPVAGTSTLAQFYHHLNLDSQKLLNDKLQASSNIEQFQDEPNLFNPVCVGRDFLDPAVLTELLYHDCPPDIIQWALTQGRRQNSMAYIFESHPLDSWPEVNYQYILCTEDRIIAPEWSRYVARKRLGIDAIEMTGGHCPQLSQPANLASVLINLTSK